MLPLPLKISKAVKMMEVEEKPDVTYADIGGCKDQIKKLRELIEMPLTHVSVRLYLLSYIVSGVVFGWLGYFGVLGNNFSSSLILFFSRNASPLWEWNRLAEL